MNTSLDERLHRYFDDLPALDGPGTAQHAMSRALSRQRHQVAGLVGCIVVVLAGLGIAGATLLDDGEQSSGPIAVEPDDAEPPTEVDGGQRWLVDPGQPLDATVRWTSAELVDDGAAVVNAEVLHNAPSDEPFGQLWRIDAQERAVLDPGIFLVEGLARIGEDLFVVGRNGAPNLQIGSVLPAGPGELALARSNDDGETWTTVTVDVDLPDDTSAVHLAAGDGFLVVQLETWSEDVLLTFDPSDLMTPVSTYLAPRNPWGVVSATGGVLNEPGIDDWNAEWTSDGRTWTAVGGPESGAVLGVPDGEPVILDYDPLAISAGGRSTSIATLVDADDDDLALAAVGGMAVIVVDEASGARHLLRSTDGVSWATHALTVPPEGFAALSSFDGPPRTDAQGRTVITTVVLGDDDRRSNALLVIDGHDEPGSAATSTAPESVVGTVTDVELSHQLIDGPDGRAMFLSTGGFVDDGFVVRGRLSRTDSDGDFSIGVPVMRWDGSAWSTIPSPVLDQSTSLGPAFSAVLVAAQGRLAMIGAIEGAEGPHLVESRDGGATWTSTRVPIDMGPTAEASWGLLDGDLIVDESDGELVWLSDDGEDLRVVGRVDVAGRAHVVESVEDELWAHGRDSFDTSWTVHFQQDGEIIEYVREDDPGVATRVLPLGDDTVTLEVDDNRHTTVTGLGGTITLNDLPGLGRFATHDVRATGDALVIAGGDEGRSNVLTLLWSSDGVSWNRYDLVLEDDLEGSGRLLAVNDERLLIELTPSEGDEGQLVSRSSFAIVER